MSDTYDYSPWLRQLADIAEDDPHKVNPCPKALRRAADALEQKSTEIESLAAQNDIYSAMCASYEQARPVIDAAIAVYVEWNRDPGNTEDDYEVLESLCDAVKKYLPHRSVTAGDTLPGPQSQSQERRFKAQGYLPTVHECHPQKDKHFHHPGGNPDYCTCGAHKDSQIHQYVGESGS